MPPTHGAIDRPSSNTARARFVVEGLAVAYIVVLLTPYAFGKIVQSQFSNRADPYKSEIRVGDLSSIELMWDLYGRAPLYETMLGGIEALCILLVFFRRTRPIGALLTLATMANVTAMNLAFGIGATFNAATLAIAALLLCVLYFPVYREWLSIPEMPAVPLSRNWSRAALAMKSLLLLISLAGAIGIWANVIRPLTAMRGDLYGRWKVESLEGNPPGGNGVEPLAAGQVIMLNKMNVLAVRTGDDFRFGDYHEDDQKRTLDLSVYRITEDDLEKLPPPGRLAERRKALITYPLGYALHGQIERLATNRAIARFKSGGDSSAFVATLRRE
jgi:hypothetical protein